MIYELEKIAADFNKLQSQLRPWLMAPIKKGPQYYKLKIFYIFIILTYNKLIRNFNIIFFPFILLYKN
jgi:hypothetical protein